MTDVDERHLLALVGTAGKAIASLPGARRMVARIREADSPRAFGDFSKASTLASTNPRGRPSSTPRATRTGGARCTRSSSGRRSSS